MLQIIRFQIFSVTYSNIDKGIDRFYSKQIITKVIKLKKFILIMVMFFSMDVFAVSDASQYYTAIDNFHYVSDLPGQDIWTKYTSIDKPFYGDCEDFAFTLENQIGGSVYHIEIPGIGAHAVLVKDGIVYDNLHDRPVSMESFIKETHASFIFKMDDWFDKHGKVVQL